MSNCIKRLTSNAQAWDVGYEEGASLREHGSPLEDVHLMRENMFERSTTHHGLRGPQVHFYASWRLGFDAGYLGQLKICPLM